MPTVRRIRRSRVLASALAVVLVGLGASALRPVPDEVAPAMTDEKGRDLVLRGFSTAGSAKGSPDGLPYFTRADLDTEYADMGTNFVRFLISWRSLEPAPGKYDQGYLAGLAERVEWYADRGYKVMLDMHQDLWGNEIIPGKGVGNGAPAWATYTDGLRIDEQDMWELYYLEPGVIRAFDHFWNTTGKHPELRSHYVGAWRAVAQKFAHDDTVIAYDLMNEPYGGSLQGPAFEAGPLTDLYQAAADAIRQVDQDSWVCVEPQAMGVNWGTPSGLGTITDNRKGEPRIAYCPHLYPLPMDLGGGYTGTTRTLVSGTVDTWLDNTLRTAKRLGDVPVILGEFGLDTTKPSALEYVDRVYDVAAKHGFGVAYWSRDDGTWGPYESDGTKRNLVGELDRPYPRAVAGRLGRILAAGAYSLEFEVDPDPSVKAPTEIYLPKSFGNSATLAEGGSVIGWDPKRRILSVRLADDADRVVVTVGRD